MSNCNWNGVPEFEISSNPIARSMSIQ